MRGKSCKGGRALAEQKQFVILGGGPGGLAAAITATAYGHRVTVFDPEGLGGNAVNHSLIPSKTLIQSVQHILQARTVGGAWDVSRWPAVMDDQTQKIARLRALLELSTEMVTVKAETGRLVTGRRHPIAVAGAQSGDQIEGATIIVSVGSRQRLLPGLKPDGRTVLVPRAFHLLKAIPDSLDIVGGGATGLEAASFFSRLGTTTRLYTSQASLLTDYASESSDLLGQAYRAFGIDVQTEKRIIGGASDDKGVDLEWEDMATGVFGKTRVKRVFLANGRAPMWDAATMQELGFDLDEQGFFVTQNSGQTSVPGVYAIGDARGGQPLLANRAMKDGERAVKDVLGLPYHESPMVEAIYCWPEVARVGARRGYRTFRSQLTPQPPPMLFHPTLDGVEAGELRIYTDEKNIVVGGEAVALHATELMNLVAVAIASRTSLLDLMHISFATPSAAEWFRYLSPAPDGAS